MKMDRKKKRAHIKVKHALESGLGGTRMVQNGKRVVTWTVKETVPGKHGKEMENVGKMKHLITVLL
jgi:hypothetical protein